MQSANRLLLNKTESFPPLPKNQPNEEACGGGGGGGGHRCQGGDILAFRGRVQRGRHLGPDAADAAELAQDEEGGDGGGHEGRTGLEGL